MGDSKDKLASISDDRDYLQQQKSPIKVYLDEVITNDTDVRDFVVDTTLEALAFEGLESIDYFAVSKTIKADLSSCFSSYQWTACVSNGNNSGV